MLISKIHKYLQQQYIDGYTPYNTNKSPGYKKMKDGYFYLGKHAPHKRVSYDAMYKTDWYNEYDESYREAELLRVSDPATWEANFETRREDADRLIQDLGLTGILSDEEIEDGYILCCQSHPTSDEVEIEID